MDLEEISPVEDVEPPRLGPAGWIGIALVCLLGGVFLMSGRGSDAAAAHPPLPPLRTYTAAPIPGPTARTVLTDPSQGLNLGGICKATTDHHSSLVVSFELVNFGTVDITVTAVKPLLPLPGLKQVGETTAGGTCLHPGTSPAGGLLPTGTQQLYTMRFKLPKTCPQALPVQAKVHVRVKQMVGMTTIGVFADLGAVQFDTCP